MTYDLFIELTAKLARWCNKNLNDTQREIYWEAIKKIPDKAFEDIIDTLIGEIPPSGKLPKPDDISLQWFYWRQAHPDSVTPEYKQTWCNECDGDGIFSVWYQDYIVPKNQIPPGKDPDKFISWYRMFVPCSKCQNWKRQFPTKGPCRPKRFYTRLDILSMGWRLTDPCFDNKNKLQTPLKKDLNQLVDIAVNDMDAELLRIEKEVLNGK